jgi:hypothetical protein
MVDPITVRASSLPSYAQCSRRSAAIMLFGELERPFGLRRRDRHIGAVVGTGSHAGIAHVMRAFRDTGALPDIKSGEMSAAKDVAVASVRQDAHEGVIFDPVSPSIEIAESQVLQILGMYTLHVDPAAVPVLVERGLKMSIGEGLIVTGHMDRVDQLTVTRGEPRDLKTGRHTPAAHEQYGAYLLLYRSNAAFVPELKDLQLTGAFVEEYLPRVPRGKLQPPPVIRRWPQGLLEREALSMARRMERDLRVFRESQVRTPPGDPEVFPNNSRSWLCNRRLCPAWRSGWCAAGFLKPEKDDDQ